MKIDGPRITVLGGGTGLSTLLMGLKEYTNRLTAIVTVTDEGGSSGRLRREYKVLPPGDIRNCLVALADETALMSRLFQYRFRGGPDRAGRLAGHSFGNLFLVAMSELAGGFDRGIVEASKVLAVRGRVLPVTLRDVMICAERVNGSVSCGEMSIVRGAGRIRRVFLRPGRCPAAPAVVEAIRGADMVLLGPGSLYTSVIPNILVAGVREALRTTRARRLYVCNVMTQPGETDGYSAFQHLQAVEKHGGPGLLDGMVVNTANVPPALALRYARERSYPVMDDATEVRRRGLVVHGGDLISRTQFARHDPARLARFIMRIVRAR